MNRSVITLAALIATCWISDSAIATQRSPISPKEAKAIAKEAYIYGFPMVMNYKTIHNYWVDKENPEYKGPLNQLSCAARLYTPDDKAVVTPNADTPYCMFLMDARAEPMVLSVPEMEPERFYHFQLIDLYTHNFAYVGTLTTGNKAGKFLIAGPGWNAEKPEGITGVIRSETGFVFNVTRTQLFGPNDLSKVKKILDSYDLQPLSAFLGTKAPSARAMPDFPKWVEGSQFDERFFSYLDFMLSLLENPLEEEKPLWGRLARLGLSPKNTFDFAALSAQTQDALRAGVTEALGEIEHFIPSKASDPLASAKLSGTRAFLARSAKKDYGHENHYLIRSVAAHLGLYGNSAVEAIYPAYLTDADQRPLDASANRYTVTFEKGTLPPVRAFWSLTMCDGKTQLFIRNPLDRYLLSSPMMDQFQKETDGSVILHIAKDSPGAALESNWLPAPDGPFYMVLRLYGPEPEALEGKWTPPILHKAALVPQDDELVIVNVDNFVRAETATQIDRGLKFVGAVNKWFHVRQPTPLDQQGVIRMNRDTLYSSAVVDISNGATFTMPDSENRYMSVMVVNEDHYVNKVIHEAGPYELTMEEFETPYVILVARTLVNASDPADIKKANALQDQMKIEAASAKPYTHPNYDEDSYKATFEALLKLGRGISDTRRTFGKKEEVSEVRHLLATAWGWGGLPINEAYYLNVEPNLLVGAYRITVKDVPVDAFWSITVYNKDGYLQENEYNAYSVNDISATPNPDGSFTIHFGGDPESTNYLPIMEGWNYVVRLYRPRKELLDGRWTFPSIEPVP